MATWRSLEQYAPFAQILVRYMWEARPPLNPNQLAIRAGLRRQVLSQWLNAPATAELHPDPAAVVKVARAMGVPVADLLIAAGHTTETDPLMDRPGAWTYILQHVEAASPLAPRGQEEDRQDESWDESTRQHVLTFLRALATADTDAHVSDLASAHSAAAVTSPDTHSEAADAAVTDDATSPDDSSDV